jgi:hypothetical protein
MPLESPGKNLDGVRLFARGGDTGLPGTAAVQVRLNIGLGERQPWRASIHDNSDASTVRFPPGGDAKQLSKRITHDRPELDSRAGEEKALNFFRVQ